MRIALIIAVAVLALVAGMVSRSLQNAPSAPAAAVDLGAVNFPDLEGRPHRMDEWKGRVLVVNFWATWCPPCLEEMPAFVKLQDEFAAQGLQFVGIAIDGAEPVREFLKATPVDYPIMIGADGGADWAASLGNRAQVLPFSAVFDRSGKLVHVDTGTFTREEVLEVVKPLLESTPH